ncbi:hypothetical protein ACFO75_003725 [Escherichia coli]
MSNTTTYANQCNSFSPSSIVEMLSGYGCKKMWLYRTTNTQGETLLVLLDEENGIYEEMASRLDAPDIRRCARFSDDFHENAVLQSARTDSDTPSRLT